MTIIEMRVHMDCAGCESKIKKALHKIKGVDNVDIDMVLQKVTVTGWADQKKVLKTVRKTGKRAEFWDNYHNNNLTSYTYCMSAVPTTSSYNYYKHGYDRHYNTGSYFAGNSTIFGTQTCDAFSDENPHGCFVM